MSFPPGAMICTAWPSACRALMCWRSVSPMWPTRYSRDDKDGAAGRARRASEGYGGRRDAWCCAPCCCSGTSFKISSLSSAWPSSSSRIFSSSSSTAITCQEARCCSHEAGFDGRLRCRNGKEEIGRTKAWGNYWAVLVSEVSRGHQRARLVAN